MSLVCVAASLVFERINDNDDDDDDDDDDDRLHVISSSGIIDAPVMYYPCCDVLYSVTYKDW